MFPRATDTVSTVSGEREGSARMRDGRRRLISTRSDPAAAARRGSVSVLRRDARDGLAGEEAAEDTSDDVLHVKHGVGHSSLPGERHAFRNTPRDAEACMRSEFSA